MCALSFTLNLIEVCSGRVLVGDLLLALTNKKRHDITCSTSLEYVKRKIMGPPRTTCRLRLQRNGVQFDVELSRGGFLQPSGAINAPEHAVEAVTQEANVSSPQRSEERIASRATSTVFPQEGGVGLVVGKDLQGNIIVQGVAPRGPAGQSGQVMEGDIILCIRNKNEHLLTAKTSLEYVKRKLRGVPRSICVLTLSRRSKGDMPGGKFEVRLTRAHLAVTDPCSDPALQPPASLEGPGVDEGRDRAAGRAVITPRVQSIRLAKGSVVGGKFGRDAPYCGVGIVYVRDGYGCAVTAIEKGSTAEAVGTVSHLAVMIHV